MIHPIIVPVRNNLHLTREAVKSFRKQDIAGGVEILVIDNESTDGTPEWLKTQPDLFVMRNSPAKSVAASWNAALRYCFIERDAEYALVSNNDVELRPDAYRRLVDDGDGFVTCVGVRERDKVAAMTEPDPAARRPHPDFSCFLIRRDVYFKVGPFDENFLIAFCEDSDYDCRMWQAGIRASCIDLPFLHHGSQTIKNADDTEAVLISRQAEKNRAYFKRKHGCEVGSAAYYEMLGKANGPEA